jgi:hypothetical protein
MDKATFKRGDLVWATYHWSAWFVLFLADPPFPAKVLFRWPFKKHHHFRNEPCHWYVILWKGWLPVLFPETCLQDLNEAVKQNTDWMMSMRKDMQPGDCDAICKLSRWNADCMTFLNANT